ncbi:MAG: UDP-N-acetylmuramoyl-L-alanine--D-glutamate ligase [Clostridia bacterium]|nr:UDP-N-acetylmuramoyl-L-alanine--D-glutamate ligase [Clostridia bacterium]
MNVIEYKKSIKGKKISVVGIGVSNVPLVEFLLDGGANVTAHDKRTKEQLGEVYDKLKDFGAEFVLGDDYLDNIPIDTEIIFKTPGLRPDVPQLLAAERNGAFLTSEMELFFELCPCPIIAVTGSDGKTTTTTLIGEMLKKEGYNCYIGGNIGKPLVGEVEKMMPKDMVVVELSSFQLFSMRHSADTAVVTNVTPNHLDWHKDFNEYIEAKKNIFANNDNCRVILNFDNEITRSFNQDTKNAMYFGRQNSPNEGIVLEDGKIVLKTKEDKKTMLLRDDIKLPGLHNVENYMAAIGAVYPFVSLETIKYTARNFGGVPHRIELVRELDGVRYYNDSIASSPARTTAGLKSFDKKVILIAGGYDKKIPFDEFGSVINEYVKELILVGLTSEKIEKSVKDAPNYSGICIHRETEFKKAVETAKACATNGDIVLLSPACASFDLFKNFEERGNTFKDIVNGF